MPATIGTTAGSYVTTTTGAFASCTAISCEKDIEIAPPGTDGARRGKAVWRRHHHRYHGLLERRRIRRNGARAHMKTMMIGLLSDLSDSTAPRRAHAGHSASSVVPADIVTSRCGIATLPICTT